MAIHLTHAQLMQKKRFQLKCAQNVILFLPVSRKCWTLLVRSKNSASVLVARSNSLQHKVDLLEKALLFSAFFYVLVFSLPVNAREAGNAKDIENGAFACPPTKIDESHKVSYVFDGDTIQLEDGRKIRLIGIDTPEVFSRNRRIIRAIKQHGELAKKALRQQLELSHRRIGLAYGSERFDRYNRTLAHVFLPNGKNLQAWLIKQGYAIAFTTPPNDRMSDCYRQLENDAIKHRRGIWQLDRYQLKAPHTLNRKSSGFHRLQGTVTHVVLSKYKVIFWLDDRVEVKINRRDLDNFNVHWINHLKHKRVRVRGWLHYIKHKPRGSGNINYIMTLRHPDAIKVIH